MIRLLFYAGLLASALGGFLWFVHYERGIGAMLENMAWVELQQEQTRLLNLEQLRISKSQSATTLALQERLNNAKASAANAASAADGLRERYTQLIASACTPASAAGVSPPTNSPGVLTGLLDSLTALARRYAQIADDARERGKAAEEHYDSLNMNR